MWCCAHCIITAPYLNERDIWILITPHGEFYYRVVENLEGKWYFKITIKILSKNNGYIWKTIKVIHMDDLWTALFIHKLLRLCFMWEGLEIFVFSVHPVFGTSWMLLGGDQGAPGLSHQGPSRFWRRELCCTKGGCSQGWANSRRTKCFKYS